MAIIIDMILMPHFLNCSFKQLLLMSLLPLSVLQLCWLGYYFLPPLELRTKDQCQYQFDAQAGKILEEFSLITNTNKACKFFPLQSFCTMLYTKCFTTDLLFSNLLEHCFKVPPPHLSSACLKNPKI